MEDHRPIDPDAHRYDYYEDEIELMDLLKVIWKWKYLILAGTLLCAVGAALMSLNMTKVYRIDTVISPGVVKVEQSGNIIHIGSAPEIKSLIETGALNGRVLKRLEAPNPEALPKSLNFQSKTPKGGNELEISYETANPELGLQVLSELNQLLVEKYRDLVRYYREEYDIQIRSKASEASKIVEKIDKAKNGIATVEAENRAKISEIQAKIASKKGEIKANEANLLSTIEQMENNISTLRAQMSGKKKEVKNLQERISEIRDEIGRIRKNTDLLIEERSQFLKSAKGDNNILASVMYTNTIQQNIAYLNSLMDSVNNVNQQIFQKNVDIEKLENDVKDIHAKKINVEKQTKINNEKHLSDIKDYHSQIESFTEQTKSKTDSLKSEIKALQSENQYIRDEIKNLEFKREYVQNVQILQLPRKSLGPVKPKTRLNTMLAAVVGLFLTVFLSFFIEYISKYKRREAEEETPG
ncbi:MAG: hypothetical protein K9M96_07350 [Deltaproteobacteria bacterium]|nr:hypothetical protein [Deltaproteobacteria bacterium]